MATVLAATTKETRGDARAASGWTEDKRFLFDLRGWVCIPGVLTEGEIAACKAHIDRIHDDPESIDPIFQSVPEAGRPLLVADLDLEQGIEGVALGYRWDMVLRGPRATPMGI